jgi:Na+/H+ antiporter NhaC
VKQVKQLLFFIILIVSSLVSYADTDNTPDTIRINSSDSMGPLETQTAIEANFGIENGRIQITYNDSKRSFPAWWTIFPPVLAILMALIFREVVSALFIGIFSGALILHGFSPDDWFAALYSVADRYIIQALMDEGHLSVIVFSMLIGGLVAVISKNGGMKGVVVRLSKYANTPVMGQLVTWFLGLVIFFDDYANTLVVGNTMRPVTDRLNISREKLSYIVDSTAAPVAAIAFITTWIGAELGYIDQAIESINNQLGVDKLDVSPYSVFISSLEFAYYPILTLLFIPMLVIMKRDFGPMFSAEKKSRSLSSILEKSDARRINNSNESLKALEPDQNIKLHWYNAMIPIFSLIIVVMGGLIFSGYDSVVWNNSELSFTRKLSTTIGNADSYKALIWGSLTGVISAIILSTAQKIMSLEKAFETLLDGFKTMVPAITILILAWSLGSVTADLQTAAFLSSVLSDKISPYWIAEITFLLAAIIAFSTGTSWGTMTILYPVALPLAWSICTQAGLPPDESMRIFYNVVSVVLAGAVFGDHCSPISDTTVLSSMASSCRHIEHVRTQLPYAVTVALVSMLICTKMADFGLPWYIIYPSGILILYVVIRVFGKKIDTDPIPV